MCVLGFATVGIRMVLARPFRRWHWITVGTYLTLISGKKEYIWLSPMTKAPTPTEKSKKATRQHNNATINFDYTTIANRLRAVSWSNDIHHAGMVEKRLRDPNFPTNCKSCVIKRIHLKNENTPPQTRPRTDFILRPSQELKPFPTLFISCPTLRI